jgi:ATPase subunit of ABC transporter with duplicated ATPase domains
MESTELLLNSLKEFKGLGIIISHSRTLLDNLTAATMRLAHANLQICKLPYSEAKSVWDSELQKQINAKEAAQKEVKNIKRNLQKEREKQEQGAAHRKKNAAKNDTDSRSIMAGNVAGWAEARVGKNIGILRDKREKMEQAAAEVNCVRTLGRSFFMEYEQPPKSVIFSMRSFELKRGEHIWLRGPNGAGKTTLLKHILETTPIDPQKLLYLPQEIDKENIQSLLSKIKELDSKELGRVMSILASLGCSPQIAESGTSMSPGEARKLSLALGMGKFVWALLLDEPTNHLDLQSTEHLEAALKAFPGALILVSHDSVFAEACTERRVEVG